MSILDPDPNRTAKAILGWFLIGIVFWLIVGGAFVLGCVRL